MIIDIFLIISLVLAAWFGWQAGFIRLLFAVVAGFCASFVACKYSYSHEGINSYYVFAIIVLVVTIIGVIVSRLVKFFYLNFFDRVCGLIFSLTIWILVAVNLVIPVMIKGTHGLEKQQHIVYEYISDKVKSKTPVFKEYIPEFLEKKIIMHEKR